MNTKAFLALALVAVAAAQDTPPKFRLGDTVVPVRYVLDLTIVPTSDTYTGTVDIDVNVRKATPNVWLHARDLEVKEASIRSGDGTGTARTIKDGKSVLGLIPDRMVKPGPATLHLVFEGRFAKAASDGFFYNKEGGDSYILTQFESISARRAFPCFDEPRFKTPWQLTMRVPKADVAVANTPVVSETDGPSGLKTVKFAETRPLPTYLVAMAVGPFEFVDAGTAGMKHTPLRIITTRGRKDEARYAASVTKDIFNRLEQYFGIPYPYEKLDSIAVPLAFGFGAMENAGLITYAQTLLLAKPAEESITFQRSYASVAAHEIAHQWFGDLVTTAWWDDIWLNEAFATWMEQRILATWKPEWKTAVSDVFEFQRVMGQDSLVSARKIRQPVLSEDDIANAFDGITYTKGAAVIRMFENWLGPEKFREGVQAYLKKYSWRAAAAGDFLGSISEAAGRDVAPAFSSFLDQTGVPLLTASLDCSGGGARLKVRQERFRPLGSTAAGSERWQIPICARPGSACALVTQEQGEIRLPGTGCPDWVLANREFEGYYRTAYEPVLLDKLLTAGVKNLDTVEVVGLLGDSRALVNAGRMPATAALRLAERFGNDPNRFVLQSSLQTAGLAAGNLLPEELRPQLEAFIRRVYGPRARQLGWLPKAGEDADTTLLRPELVGTVSRLARDPELIAEARRLADEWLKDRKAVPPEVAAEVLEVAAQNGDQAFFDRLLAAAKATADQRDKMRLMRALGSFHDPAIAREALNLTLSRDFDPRLSMWLLFAPLGYPATRDMPFEFVKENFDAIVKWLPRGMESDAGAYLPQVGSAFCDEQHRQALADFFEPRIKQFTGGPRILANTLERIAICTAQRERNSPGVAEFLRGAGRN